MFIYPVCQSIQSLTNPSKVQQFTHKSTIHILTGTDALWYAIITGSSPATRWSGIRFPSDTFISYGLFVRYI